MSKIINDSLTRSGTKCSMLYSYSNSRHQRVKLSSVSPKSAVRNHVCQSWHEAGPA